MLKQSSATAVPLSSYAAPLPAAISASRRRTAVRYAWAALPVTCGVAISALLFRMAIDPEVWRAWASWFPFALRPVFYDLSITLQHLHEAAAGTDPLGDPESEFAYPRAVLWLRYLGLHYIPAEWLGFLQGIALTFAVVLVLRPFTARRATGTSVLLFTPPMLLGFERGNLDFALFLLCAAAAWQWSRSGRARKLVWPVTAAIAAALLKLYPIFAMIGAALAETGRRRRVWLFGITFVVGCWFFSRDDLSLIIAKVPVVSGATWGCLAFFTRLERFLAAEPELFVWLIDVRWPLLALTVYVALAAAAAVVGLRLASRFSSVAVPRTESAYYWVGALICCGSFVGSNIAYRWVFVLLTIPLLLRCMRSPEMTVALWARMTLVAILASLFAPLESRGGLFVLIQMANWSCILLLIAGCTALRVTTKSPIFAFALRICAPRRRPALRTV